MRARALVVLTVLCALAAATRTHTDNAPGPANGSATCKANPQQPDQESGEGDQNPCKTCSADSSTCQECWPTWGTSADGECAKCNDPSRCFTCDGDPDFCTLCGDFWGEAETGFYATKQGQCKACPQEDCRECESLTGECTRCSSFMGVMDDGTCQRCDDGQKCLSCNGDTAVCQECMSSFFLEDGECKDCPDNCEECPDADSCTECNSVGYTLDNATALCVPCASEGCTSCSAGADECESCDTSYTNMKNGSCAKCTDPHCTTCTSDAPDKCEICADVSLEWGVDKPTSTCVKCKIENCAACQQDATDCDWCEDGFYNDKINHVCSPCKEARCTSCGSNATPGHDPDVEECFGCEQGWAIDEGIPPKCVPEKEGE